MNSISPLLAEPLRSERTAAIDAAKSHLARAAYLEGFIRCIDLPGNPHPPELIAAARRKYRMEASGHRLDAWDLIETYKIKTEELA